MAGDKDYVALGAELQASHNAMHAKIERLEASNKQMRDALTRIGTTNYAGYAITGKTTSDDLIDLVKLYYREFNNRVEIARAALTHGE